MPELPEVETIVRELSESDLIGCKIAEATVFWPRTIADLEIDDFCSRIANQNIEHISRRGKFIVIALSQDTLLIHLRMTGKLTISRETKVISSHERVRLKLSDGRILHYEDQRKFGKWYLLKNPEVHFERIGLEPLSTTFTFKAFKQILQNSSQQIKPFLLNQKHVAGLGNIYVDEALWDAKIHPQRKVSSLNQIEIAALHLAIVKVLEQGIAHMGTSLGSMQANYFSVSGRRGGNQTQLKVFRREGSACPRCGCEIIKITVAQRGTHLCPRCQKL